MTQNALQLSTEGYGPVPHAPADNPLRRPTRLAAASATPQDGATALARAIDRLEEVVQEETAALRRRAQVDLKEYNSRKSHGLLELTRATRLFEPGGLTEPMRTRLAQLRANLEANRAAITIHLEAVREVAAMMADAVHRAESDGTYTASAAGLGAKP